jgi:hypothetical protein
MEPENRRLFVYSALLPVAEDGPGLPPTMHPVTTLAGSLEQARELAAGAGLELLGQLGTDGRIMEPP